MRDFFEIDKNYFQMQQYNYYDNNKDDYFERTYIYNSSLFKISDSARFIVNKDGGRYIKNYGIEPFSFKDGKLGGPFDNFDFESDDPLAKVFNFFAEKIFDPLKIGSTVAINFIGSRNLKDYTKEDYLKDKTTNDNLDTTVKDLTTAFKKLLSDAEKFFDDSLDDTKKFFDDYYDDFKKLWSDAEKFYNDIDSSIRSIFDKMKDAVNALKDPLIIDLKNDGLNLSDPNNRYIEPIYFDLNNDGIKEKTGWIIPKYEVINSTDGISNGFITNNPFYFGDEKQASNNPYSKPVIDSTNAINGNFVAIDSRDGINSSFITIIDKPYSNVTYNNIKQEVIPVIDDVFLAIDKIMPQNEAIKETTLLN